jgi:pyruvate,orthophosphate dikinase
MENIVYFNKDLESIGEEKKHEVGIRGRRAVELAEMRLPIAPGFIIDSTLTKKLPDVNIKDLLTEYIGKIEKETKKVFGDPKKPLLLKVVVSSDLNVPHFPSIHNIGLNDEIIESFAKMTSEEFAYGEYCYLMRNIGTKLYDIEASEFPQPKVKDSKALKSALKSQVEDFKKTLDSKFSQDVYDQLVEILKMASTKYCDSDIDVDGSLSIMVQAMVYGNLGQNSYSGTYFTRNIVTGDSDIMGYFLKNEFDVTEKSAKDISTIDKKYFDKLTDIARKVETNFIDIRAIKFTIEEGVFWLVEQREVTDKSTQSHLRMLLDLHNKKQLDKKALIKMVQPSQINELLHKIVDTRSVKKSKSAKGGISGSSGAAVGRVFFSTARVLEEHKRAIVQGSDTRLILAMVSTFAEDVKAIEVSQGVITAEGGYSSHAPVVARSIGKVAMINPQIKFKNNSFTVDGVTVKEGDYISMSVPFSDEPTIYFDKVDLIEPDFEKNGLTEFIDVSQSFIDTFDVRANADLGRDAEVAKSFKAKGIGLCRTEHMFFNEKRLMRFREMILAKSEDERRKALEELRPMQRSDFYDLFKIMQGLPVTIRLLDSPLHEFLPRSDEGMNEFIKYMTTRNKGVKPADIRARCDELHELNPMLGHRGCRVAVTFPEIYEMQCRAIFEAACMLKKERIVVKPEIMIPIVMSEQELKFIKNGKKIEGTTVKGIRDIRDEVLSEYGVDEIEYSVGSMIELPAAALRAGQIAQYAEFFSFGTNDLTQTTFGLSRDDVNSFFPSYSLFDIIKANPFKVLGDEVKELIEVAAIRGRLTRPDIKIGLCGEHGADPENIAFCINAGLNYVSCSPYAIPLAKLAIAQYNIAAQEAAEAEAE